MIFGTSLNNKLKMEKEFKTLLFSPVRMAIWGLLICVVYVFLIGYLGILFKLPSVVVGVFLTLLFVAPFLFMKKAKAKFTRPVINM